LNNSRIKNLGAEDDQPEDLRAVTWGLDHRSLAPLLLFGGDEAIFYVYDVTRHSVRARLRGHGGVREFPDITVELHISSF
jgi:hypothetical protein